MSGQRNIAIPPGRAPWTVKDELRTLGWPPPRQPYRHVSPRSTRDPGTKPLPSITEAMAAIAGKP